MTYIYIYIYIYIHTPYINSRACGGCFADLRSLFSNLCQEHSGTFNLADSDLLERFLIYRCEHEQWNKLWLQRFHSFYVGFDGVVGWRSWYRHYATIPKVAGSIPVVVIGIFIEIIIPAVLWPWGSTQPLTEMSTRNIFWGVKAAGA